MDLVSWYKNRGVRFILQRAHRLNQRYGIRSEKGITRTEHCLQQLAELGCSPTFAVPGIVVERHLPFILRLQELGAEIAVHGYNHVDLKACQPETARAQLVDAAELFKATDLQVYGFRCPYLSIRADLYTGLPAGLFQYSSNQAIQWPIGNVTDTTQRLLFETLRKFYLPVMAGESPCVPWKQGNLIEIPVSVPDDLQLYDGLGYNLQKVASIWSSILRQTHQSGEIFNLMFHPELATFCETPFIAIIEEARQLQPEVWIARLCDVSAWWQEKAAFQARATPAGSGFTVEFDCNRRATLLSRGLEEVVPARPWVGRYTRLEPDGPLHLPDRLPFIGLAPDVPAWVAPFLRNLGYLVESGPLANDCTLYIEPARLVACRTHSKFVENIEADPAPLIRFWPWPNGQRSALCITGDLDALSYLDYAARLFYRRKRNSDGPACSEKRLIPEEK